LQAFSASRHETNCKTFMDMGGKRIVSASATREFHSRRDITRCRGKSAAGVLSCYFICAQTLTHPNFVQDR